MEISDVYPLSFLSDQLITKQAVTVSLKRNDEQSGSGDGRYWIAQLARPLWQVEMTLEAMGRSCIPRARAIDAKIRALAAFSRFGRSLLRGEARDTGHVRVTRLASFRLFGTRMIMRPVAERATAAFV